LPGFQRALHSFTPFQVDKFQLFSFFRKMVQQRRTSGAERDLCTLGGWSLCSPMTLLPAEGGAFDTPAMLAKRQKLKKNPKVLAALKEWWVATDADRSGAIDFSE